MSCDIMEMPVRGPNLYIWNFLYLKKQLLFLSSYLNGRIMPFCLPLLTSNMWGTSNSWNHFNTSKGISSKHVNHLITWYREISFFSRSQTTTIVVKWVRWTNNFLAIVLFSPFSLHVIFCTLSLSLSQHVHKKKYHWQVLYMFAQIRSK